MTDAAALEPTVGDRDRRIAEAVRREQGRLRAFIRRRVPEPGDAEDVLQDVFQALVEANRLMMPIEHVTGWLFRVARNRITDLFRRRTLASLDAPVARNADDEPLLLEEIMPSPDDGPDAIYARTLLLDEIEDALDELPGDQREVFIAHEIDGRTFREMAEESGVSINTLLSRKRYAVLHLRERLREVYEDFTGETRSRR